MGYLRNIPYWNICQAVIIQNDEPPLGKVADSISADDSTGTQARRIDANTVVEKTGEAAELCVQI